MSTAYLSFKDFLSRLVVEELHPDLQKIIKAPPGQMKNKKARVVATLAYLKQSGQKTGVEGQMPEGSSRAYLKHEEHHPVTVDGQQTHMATGIKFAVNAYLDSYHNKKQWGDMKLGQLQNEAENSDHFINSQYRILAKHDDGTFHTNHEHGIFPPLIDHDDEHHEWAHVGHVSSVSEGDFKKITATPTHRDGISHKDFMDALKRDWNRNHGKYYRKDMTTEEHLDHVTAHPLVQKFIEHGNTTHMPPWDYDQIENMGKWKHPVTGEHHIVARDHGFNANVYDAYKIAQDRAKQNNDD